MSTLACALGVKVFKIEIDGNVWALMLGAWIWDYFIVVTTAYLVFQC